MLVYTLQKYLKIIGTSTRNLITCRVFTRLCFFRLSLISIDATRSCWPAFQNIWRNKKMTRWMDWLEKRNIFFITEFTYC